jgi:hypothetical protein
MIWTLAHNKIAICCIESDTPIKIGRLGNADIEASLINNTNNKHIDRDD